jgi:hypothetical protein
MRATSRDTGKTFSNAESQHRMPSFGWTYLSREALRKAQAQLANQVQGVRDEIGFLELHQRYADRFFPGTSVLHTRLRYALFVPWMYEALANRRISGPVQRAVEREEMRLVGRLASAGAGVIGITKPNQPAQQPPSVVYWGALATWGIVRDRSDGRTFSRREVQAQLATSTRRTDDDGTPLDYVEPIFCALPPMREKWDEASSLSFQLSAAEGAFLQQRWVATPCVADPARESLLARLARANVSKINRCWDAPVLALAGPDKQALVHAGRAAALSAIGRGVYAALVETICVQHDRRPAQESHRRALVDVLAEYRTEALRFDIDDIEGDIAPLSLTLRTVLTATLRWVKHGSPDPAPLFDCYADAELARKRNRARLALTLDGRNKRAEWVVDEHPEPAPIHYRWSNVRGLVVDLKAAA